MLTPLLETPSPLARLELLHLTLPQRSTFHSAIGVRREKQALLVIWRDGLGGWGAGEVSCRPDPFFSGEFIDGAVLMLRDHLAPLLKASGTIADLAAACARIRGWPFATGAVIAAALDALRRRGVPDPVDRWGGSRAMRVPVGVSLGLYPDAALTIAAAEHSAARGFRRVKLKISPDLDPGVLPALREALGSLRLSLDANGSFGPEHIEALAGLAALRPAMLEQPFPPGRLDLDRRLKTRAPELRLCLDESLIDLGALYTAKLLGVLDVANLKPGRLGGPLACDAALRWCREQGVAAWVGGMFETGIGRHANLRVASCIPDAAAHDTAPPSSYLVEDIVADPLVMDTDGTIALSDAPPTIRWDVVARRCVRRLELPPGSGA
jgi:O-succinylbenzoate synthase